MTDAQLHAERALNVARRDLAESGSPAHVAVAVLAEHCEVAPIVHASRDSAHAQARMFAEHLPHALAVMIVGLQCDRDRMRFVVTPHDDVTTLLVRTEVLGGDAEG